jgi:hypothetical protein
VSTGRRIPGYLNALLLLILLAPWLVAEPRQAEDDKKKILARFSFRPGGEPILLSVQLDGKLHLCLLDTGATVGIYDPSLPLGKSLATQVVETPNGTVKLSQHAPPPAKLGDMALHDKGPGFIFSLDFTQIRQVAGEPLVGIIGMDFLRQHIVQMDFDAGEVRFLRTADDACGKAFPLTFSSQGIPTVKLKIADVVEALFQLDTGACGLGSVDIEKGLFDGMVEKQHLKVVGKSLSETLNGTGSSRLARSKSLSLGDFNLTDPIVGDGRVNTLGLSFLVRFQVTLDFPNAKMYLKKGKAFAAPDLYDLSGLRLLRIDGKTVVHSVAEESPAAVKGVKAKDQLVKIGNMPVDRMTLSQLRRLLATPADAVEVALRRDDEDRKVVLPLK